MKIPEYIEIYNEYKTDINTLVSEFNSVNHMLEEKNKQDAPVLVHKTLTLYKLGKENNILKSIPYTRKVAYDLINVYNFNVVTYRCILPYTCYSWHKDGGDACLHIPIVTNEGSRFVYEHKSFHMPADGSTYVVNNSKNHSFMNGGSEPRIHLTFERLV
jgi:hypothetical protein